MSLIRKHVAVLQAWACLDLVLLMLTIYFFRVVSCVLPLIVGYSSPGQLLVH